MQKTFKNQQGREFLLLDLPEQFTEIAGLVRDHLYYWTKSCSPLMGDYPYSELLPSDEYQILCLAKDATEQQAESVVDKAYNAYNELSHKLYCDEIVSGCYTVSAKESLTSLITSLGFKQDDNVLILEKI